MACPSPCTPYTSSATVTTSPVQARTPGLEQAARGEGPWDGSGDLGAPVAAGVSQGPWCSWFRPLPASVTLVECVSWRAGWHLGEQFLPQDLLTPLGDQGLRACSKAQATGVGGVMFLVVGNMRQSPSCLCPFTLVDQPPCQPLMMLSFFFFVTIPWGFVV